MEITVNGMKIFYEQMGSGRPLLLLHGNGEDHGIFYEAAEILREHYTVYLPDTRGHGGSGEVEEYHYADMAEDVRDLIQALKLERPFLYGFSDGGIVGLLTAIRYPGLLSGLAVSGANTSPKGIKTCWRRFFAGEYQRTKDPKLKLMLREPSISEKELSGIRIPALVTAGSRDMIRRRDTEKIAAAIPESRLHILRGEDHGSYIVHEKKIGEILLEFFQQCQKAEKQGHRL